MMCLICTNSPLYSKTRFGWKPKNKSVRAWPKADNILLCGLECDNELQDLQMNHPLFVMPNFNVHYKRSDAKQGSKLNLLL